MSTVLVTGCSSGIGLRTSLGFARQGHTTVASVRNLDRASPLRDAATDEGLDLHVVALDVTDGESVERAVKEVVADYGGIDILVNNAGIELRSPIEDASDEEVLAQFDTNVFGLVRVTRAVLPVMREQRSGVIVTAWSLIWIYVRWANGHYDTTVASLRDAGR
ncbi:MAG: SDR family NAD(P)-dependent oxidoreductase [Chloroflexi bacterium]|nr:SDR family NAD(P)-dependent oxidoreductase [Chloroflexota bacterium]